MNLHRGCQHRCIYCDSRSECCQVKHFDREVLVKENAVELLPGLRQKYERAYGERYHCPVLDADRLANVFDDLCRQHGIATRIRPYRRDAAKQLSLF